MVQTKLPVWYSQTFRVAVGQEKNFFVKMLPYNKEMQTAVRASRVYQVKHSISV
jgi:hypothetical protein